MDMIPISPPDREAIGQLRTLLRGDHRLSMEEEEQLIADFLAGRTPALIGSSLELRCAYLPGSLQPVVIQAGVVGIVAGMGLTLARMSGNTLYTGAYREGSQLGLVLVGMGFILGAPVLWLLLSRHMSPATRMALTGTATAVGAGVLEWAALHWPSTDPRERARLCSGQMMMRKTASECARAGYVHAGPMQQKPGKRARLTGQAVGCSSVVVGAVPTLNSATPVRRAGAVVYACFIRGGVPRHVSDRPQTGSTGSPRS